MDRLPLTPRLRDAIKAVEDAERDHVPGRDASAGVEIPKLALAEIVLEAVRLDARVSRLPARADGGIVFVRLQPVRRRRAR